MLSYRPCALVAQKRLCSLVAIRALATSPFPAGNDAKLHGLLGVEPDSTSTASIWGDGKASTPPPASAENDPELAVPPQAPHGSLPPPTTPKGKSKDTHKLPGTRQYHLHVLASRNNTILTLTDELYRPQSWVSAGLCGFKKVQRSGYEAGYQCAVRMFKKIEVLQDTSPIPLKLDMAFRGYGFGREAVFRALMATEGDKIRDTVVLLKDTTPLKIGGGTKAKKMRRL